jgi:hypothetical protein
MGVGVPTINHIDSSEDILLVAINEDNSTAEITTTTAPDGTSGEIYIDGRLVALVRGSIDTLDGLDGDVQTIIYANG